MPGRLSLLFASVLSLATLTISARAQTSSPIASANTKVEVLYLQQNSNILTYNVDPENGQATLVGQPLVTAASPLNLSLNTARKDRFVYIFGTDSQKVQHIWVYATDSFGVPQVPAVQDLTVTSINQFQIDPNGRFAYAIQSELKSYGEYAYQIRLFTVNRNTGILTESPTIQGSYPPSYYCGPGFYGFSSDGSRLYIVVGCYYHDSEELTYYYRDVDQTTGNLSGGTQFFNWRNGNQGGDEVVIAGNVFFDLHNPISYQPQYNLLNVYPLTPGPKKPLIHCTAKMLSACANSGSIQIDPLGRFVVFNTVSGQLIGKVDWATQQIVDTGYSLSDLLNLYFSPDDRLLYGVQYGNIDANSTINFFVFNAQSGAVTLGEQISLNGLYNAFPAERW